MMFKRVYTETPLDGGDNPPKKVTVTYIGPPCDMLGGDSRVKQYDLLRTVVETPGLLDCGLTSFQTLRMEHNGSSWVLTLEAKT